MPIRRRVVERRWPHDVDDVVLAPRHDLMVEAQLGDERGEPAGETTTVEDRERADHRPRDQHRFVQDCGPFIDYERVVYATPDGWTERTEYSYRLPGFGWLIALPVRHQIARRGRARPSNGVARAPWWAPPDVLNARQLMVLGLLVVATIAAAYMNTLFSQTSTFAADGFGVGDAALGWGGAIVRLGMVISLPLAIAADRIGRRRVLIITAFAAPTLSALGALAPSFPILVATQTVGRPLAITLDMILAVVAAEEMPKNSRAYAVAVMAMAYGLGAGLVVMGLPLADIGLQWWRADYVFALVWLGIGVTFVRSLPESVRFAAPHVRAPRIDRRRLLLISSAVVAGNVFIAPATYFLNRYLSDVRELSATSLALFSLSVGTPAGIGLVVGGKLADRRGRRLLIMIALPISTTLIVASFSVAGFMMWLTSFTGGLIAGVAAPALLVYRAELFPTGSRGRAAGMVNVAALVAGSVSIAAVGAAVDRGIGFGEAMTVCALGQLIVVLLVGFGFPESAHTELEDLNEIDEAIAMTNLS